MHIPHISELACSISFHKNRGLNAKKTREVVYVLRALCFCIFVVW